MKKIIALCGYPESGKSTAQKIIERRYGAVSIDDGKILRDAAMILYGLTEWHVTTQEGKKCLIEVSPGVEIEVRKLLGELGKYLEGHDINFVAYRALADARRNHPGAVLSFGSVRREQGKVYSETGEALVLEIRRDGCDAVNDFDRYNPAWIDLSIENRFDPEDVAGSLARLEAQIAELLDPHFAPVGTSIAAE